MKITVFLIFIICGYLPVISQVENSDSYMKSHFIRSSDTLLYRFLQPENRDNSKKYPLVIFLHGAGERGNDNEAQLFHGSGLFTENSKEYPCFALFPQCPKDKKWVEVDWSADSHQMPSESSDLLKSLMELTEQLKNTYAIDNDRIYIMGLSMGGFGTWELISRFPDKFAAAVPICGGGDENMASGMVDVPIWAFHGDRDRIVKTIRTRNMINAIKSSGGNAKYTEYKDTGHLCWSKAFAETELLSWLFSHSLKNR
jgi:predicted peptidase